ncbi:unnamed protein product [Hymenolepis diminuta]|uniref:non-specific protein-tyrosine kinase n=1 Tax=Hymenolepis diminuta TaxID=6216 RepID=A0A3P6XIV3_HYMDI|nr:unnamed protein product [Hymenolepis diminuta]
MCNAKCTLKVMIRLFFVIFFTLITIALFWLNNNLSMFFSNISFFPLPPFPGGLSLSIRYAEGKVCHFKIKHDPPSGGICITSSLVFPDLISLINHYTSHADGLCCRLSQPYPRPPPFLPDLSRRTKDHWEIERSSLVLLERLGEGQFGEVWRGEYEGWRPVAIKTLKEGTMSKEEFLKEARIMKALRHKHLVQLFAVVTSEPIYIVTELMSKGSLLKYLQQVSCFLLTQSMGLVHRDLAARNVLVGDDDIVKIADFGLTRAINANTNAYTAKQGSKFPIKWTAPEAAYHCQFTIKSDVWSFGVVMYEIVTHGQEPFPSMTTMETLDQVNNGYRMPRPPTCPIQIYEKMLQCWDAIPSSRPTFVELLDYFNRYTFESASPDEMDGAACDGRFRRRAGYPYMGSPGREWNGNPEMYNREIILEDNRNEIGMTKRPEHRYKYGHTCI